MNDKYILYSFVKYIFNVPPNHLILKNLFSHSYFIYKKKKHYTFIICVIVSCTIKTNTTLSQTIQSNPPPQY
jgi:hypothetical protein